MLAGRGSPNGTITAMYWVVGATSVHGAVDAVRTKLVSLVAEMRAADVMGGDVPSADVAEQAVRGPWGFVVGLGMLTAAYSGVAAGTGWPPF